MRKSAIRLLSLKKSSFLEANLLLFLFALGFSVVYVQTMLYGSAISPDSISYMTAARNFIAKYSFTFDNGMPFTTWPLLYPALIALFSLFTDSMESAARLINALALGGIMALVGLILIEQTQSRIVALAGGAVTGLLHPMAFVSRYVWSEPVFTLFLIAVTRYLYLFIKNNDTRLLFLASFFCALSILTRYAGLSLFLAGVAILLLAQGPAKERVRRAAYFSFISLFPFMLLMARNYALAGNFFGPRPPSETTVLAENAFAIWTIYSWFIPPYLPLWAGITLFLLLTVLIFKAYTAKNVSSVKAINSNNRTFLLVLGTVVLTYVAFNIFSALMYAINRVGDRLLSPVAPLLVLILFLSVMIVAQSFKQAQARLAFKVIAALLLGIWSVSVAVAFVRFEVIPSLTVGAGSFNTVFWREAKSLKWLNKVGEHEVLFSNYPRTITYLTGRKALELPYKETGKGFKHFNNLLRKNKRLYVLFFHMPIYARMTVPAKVRKIPYAPLTIEVLTGYLPRKHMVSIRDLRKLYNVKAVRRFPGEATFYLITLKSDPEK